MIMIKFTDSTNLVNPKSNSFMRLHDQIEATGRFDDMGDTFSKYVIINALLKVISHETLYKVSKDKQYYYIDEDTIDRGMNSLSLLVGSYK